MIYPVLYNMSDFRFDKEWNFPFCPHVIILPVQEQQVRTKLIPVYITTG